MRVFCFLFQEDPHPSLSRKRERAREEVENIMASDVLARLIAQAEGEGATLLTLRAIAEEAGETAVQRAMERLGLADRDAHKDLSELRTLLQAWRDAKASARNAVVGWIVRVMLAGLLVLLAWRFGFSGVLSG